jgi:hypothetical protein
MTFFGAAGDREEDVLSAVKDMTCRRFGRLTVVRRAKSDADGKATWHCRCDCGNKKIVAGADLRNKHRFMRVSQQPNRCREHQARTRQALSKISRISCMVLSNSAMLPTDE